MSQLTSKLLQKILMALWDLMWLLYAPSLHYSASEKRWISSILKLKNLIPRSFRQWQYRKSRGGGHGGDGGGAGDRVINQLLT